jgi:hypothetical protein
MKNVFIKMLLFISLISCGRSYSQDSEKMKITLNNGYKIITLFEGNVFNEIVRKLENAKMVSVLSAEKAIAYEGEYELYFLDKNAFVLKKYRVINNYWVFDEQQLIYMRCSILSELRDYFIAYLFKENEDLYMKYFNEAEVSTNAENGEK